MKFKALPLILFALYGGSVFAAGAEPINLVCTTESLTTSFVAKTEGDQLLVRVIHHNGSQYAPAINGVYTPHDLPILAEQAKAVLKMKRVMDFHWPMKNCKRHDDLRFECFATDDVEEGEGGAKFSPFAFYSTKLVQDGIAGRYEQLELRLSFRVDGVDSAVQMPYYLEGCVAGAAAAKKIEAEYPDLR